MSLQRAASVYLDGLESNKAKALRVSNGSADEPSMLVLDPKWIVFALMYLDAFGYLLKALKTWKNIKFSDIQDAIKAFQRFFGLKPHGFLTEPDLRTMSYPRCGYPDLCRTGRDDQQQFLSIRKWVHRHMPAWRKRNLRFCIIGYVNGLSQERQRQLLSSAFQAWTCHGNINAEPTDSAKDADVLVGVGQGRSFNFDGPGGVLAWAYLPDGSDRQLTMRFDLAEQWIDSPIRRGILYFNVACHEIGHIFGLDHSRISTALMAPTYNPNVAVPQENDDIPRFQARYGRRTAATTAGPDTGERRTLSIHFAGEPPVIELDGQRLC